MRIPIFIFAIALTLTLVSTPWLLRLSVRLGFVDMPAKRKLHSEPMPLLGGLAMLAGAMAALALLSTALPTSLDSPQVIGSALAVTIIAAVGLADDRWHLPALVKLLGQIAAVAVLIFFGVYVQLPIPDYANYLITVAWVVGISNAINFLDNMDGLSAGISAVAAAVIFILGVQNGQHLVAALSASVLGACVGFLRYNFHPARIFMGDAGALFLGFILAELGLLLRFPSNVNVVTWLVPLFIMGVPIFDTALVVISRSRRGKNPFTTAGKDHVSHRLRRLGLTTRETVLVLYLVAVTTGLVGILIASLEPIEAYVLAGVAILIAAAMILRLEKVQTAATRENVDNNGKESN